MKMNRQYAFLVALMMICLALFGCRDAVGQEDIREAFLKAYLTSNYDNRYMTWLEQTDAAPKEPSDELEEHTRAYYAGIQPYVSEALFTKMITNRDLFRYDKVAADKGAVIAPARFIFKEYSKADDKTTYTFAVDLRIKATGQTSNGAVIGQITIQQIGDTSIISDIYVSEYDM